MVTRTFLVLIILGVLAAPSVSIAEVGGPRVLLTWRADTYVPPHYSGKALAIANSKIIVAVDVVQNGRVADLSGQTIYWYMSDAFVGGGPGLTRISIAAPDTIGKNTIRVKVSMPDFQGGLLKYLTIPVTGPQAVIEASGGDTKIRGNSLEVRGWPYFFNVHDLSELLMSWSVAGKKPATYADPGTLHAELDAAIPNGRGVPVELSIENPRYTFEAASKKELYAIER